ncbi:cytochrome c biogenesis protein ResB [Rivibacter subsaxonicus]|uniref:Cytochrome c biogenesis protein n=1 Tax=Rivibacter subsaxonicus TaxID=457575 RepID=A0A4Q7VFY2_9BURK|nr:cytochrome c biogenesis protein ResB [Rivibacter subsaxonicus]RZT94901.1 cytochrome c biogenesis protein [Rivibacter subsaxonicus]
MAVSGTTASTAPRLDEAQQPSTEGIQLRSGSRLARESIELLSSMRFAITLLSVICIASVIGTVVKQHEPAVNYVNQFGPFWARFFVALGLDAIYSAWWFLLILAFLVLSTSLCIARNLPKILVDLRTYKEHLRASSLRSFHHRAEGRLELPREAALAHVSALLAASGWRARAQQRSGGVPGGESAGVMIAARKGAVNKLGYLSAHGAIVLVCIGGLFDGDLVVRAQMALQGKSAFGGGSIPATVPAEHVLSEANPTYRGNLFVAERDRSGTAVINLRDGVVLQPLPFEVELRKFIVEYYETGMPKLFASEVLIHDRDTGAVTPATIRVNQPAIHRGVAIYQSSFDDGGSALQIKAWPLAGSGRQPFELEGKVGSSQSLSAPGSGEPLKLELTGLRAINVENLAPSESAGATDVRAVDLRQSLDKHLGSGAANGKDKKLSNIGPSFSYKLRDASGQAREYSNYMLPVMLDGQSVFLAGVRENPSDAFRYLRIPADENGSLEGFMRLRGALADPALRAQAVHRYVQLAVPADKPELAQQLEVSARRALGLFSGAEPAVEGKPASAGLQALSDFLEANVPAAERERTSGVLVRILGGTLFELMNLARERDGLKPLAAGDTTQAFMTQALMSLSDSVHYPAPALLMLGGFEQRQASVFQVTRAPGKTLVYLGCALLIIGVFSMLYVRERRLWVWLEADDQGGTHVRTALSSTRQTMDTDREFEQWRDALLPGPTPQPAGVSSR